MSAGNNMLQLGIDLGTSRSAISGSNGERHVVESYVGWPVDMVARKLVKKPVLVGSAALKNRPMLEIHRPLERGLLKEGSDKDQQAVRQLITHLMGMAGLKETRENGSKVRAVVGVPAEALRVNRQKLREALRGFVDNLIIVSEPFAVAYSLDALLHSLVVDIGAGTTDFCVMNGRYPTEDEQKTLPNAGDWVDEQLHRLLTERHEGLSVSIHTVREWKEQHSFIGKPPESIPVTVPIGGKPTELDITEEMKAASEGLVPPWSALSSCRRSSSRPVGHFPDHAAVRLPHNLRAANCGRGPVPAAGSPWKPRSQAAQTTRSTSAARTAGR